MLVLVVPHCCGGNFPLLQCTRPPFTCFRLSWYKETFLTNIVSVKRNKQLQIIINMFSYCYHTRFLPSFCKIHDHCRMFAGVCKKPTCFVSNIKMFRLSACVTYWAGEFYCDELHELLRFRIEVR